MEFAKEKCGIVYCALYYTCNIFIGSVNVPARACVGPYENDFKQQEKFTIFKYTIVTKQSSQSLISRNFHRSKGYIDRLQLYSVFEQNRKYIGKEARKIDCLLIYSSNYKLCIVILPSSFFMLQLK